jgi:hypothetical protein
LNPKTEPLNGLPWLRFWIDSPLIRCPFLAQLITATRIGWLWCPIVLQSYGKGRRGAIP